MQGLDAPHGSAPDVVMALEFTPALQLALARAMVRARRSGAREVEPLHLLQGLLQEEEGHAAAMLARAGLDRGAQCAAFDLASFPGDEPEVLKTPMSAVVRQALAEARDFSRTHAADGHVGTDHVLIALVRSDAPLRETLSRLGW